MRGGDGHDARAGAAQVELPLAAPAILAGVRVATVVGVGTATIASAIGAGGLGDYIFRGLAMVDPIVILAGALPAALLALSADGLLALATRAVDPRRSSPLFRAALACDRRSARRRSAAWAYRGSTGRGRRRRLEELHRADRAGRAPRAGDRAAGLDRRAAPQSRRHARVRPGASPRRHRCLCRIHGHGADRALQGAARRAAAAARRQKRPPRRACWTSSASATPRAASRCCRGSASTTRLRFWCAQPRRATSTLATDQRPGARGAVVDARGSATSSWSGRMALPGWRAPTGCDFATRRASWT